jgi:uncharacterized OB-fold protein
MPNLVVPPPGAPIMSVVRIYYCTICGIVYMNFPPDRICLGCHSQGKFKQVDIESPKVTETFPA